jgi:YidC/Oxa1 family membrane protein insertase
MEKRLVLAVLLMSATVLLTNVLFPPPAPVDGEPGRDTMEAAVASPPASVGVVAPPARTEHADTVVVTSELYRYGFSTMGAALVRAELREYPSYTSGGAVQLVPRGARRFLTHKLVTGSDTIDLGQLPFQPSAASLSVDGDSARSLVFDYVQPDGFGVSLSYTFRPDGYLIDIAGRITGIHPGRATLLTEISPGLAPHEAKDHRSEQQLEVVVGGDDGIDRFRLVKIEGVEVVHRPLAWAGIKDKYFLAAVLAGSDGPFSGALLRELPDTVQVYEEEGEQAAVPRAELVIESRLEAGGDFDMLAYLGPQEFDRLGAVGADLENVTQYAYRWLEPVIRPVAAAVLWVLKTLHDALGVDYGWVLVLFGVLMRVVLWPLNAKAMRAQMKNMAVQPLMQELREKYKNDPQRQQQEMMKLVKEHGFNPLAGCFPLLIPFPVLITLFFVFQNTIAFRGAEFLWLPDLSLHDPLYILPLFLVGSMFALQLISARASGMENNPQMKMMMYFMPIMMGVLFFSLPAGLNLYYATTNVASIPQQLLIARERKRARDEMEQQKQPASKSAPPRKAKRRSGGR